MYGYLFDDYLTEYDFWGHCDVDLIFGNIRKFIDDKILNQYDRILSRGHLSLYRNCKEINELFFELDGKKHYPLPSYQKVVQDPRSFTCDECNGMS